MTALAERAAALGLGRRHRDPAAALASWAVQDSPPGGATGAVLARTTNLQPGWLDAAIADRSVISLYNARTATAIVSADEAASFGSALLPQGDAEFKALVDRSVPEQREGYAEPVEVAVAAISEALDGRALSRDDLHEALRRALPKALLPWCEGCRSHHARRGLLVMASLHGRLCLSGRDGRQPVFSRTDQWAEWKAPDPQGASVELVRRYRAGYGADGGAKAFGAWAGIGTEQARRLWELTSAAGSTGSRAAPTGVRLVMPGDPLLLSRDRETLIPEAAVRKKLWSAIPTTGLVLVDGEAAGLWKAKKAGKKLALSVDPLGDLPRGEVEAEAERLAPHRGCTSAAVSWA